MGKRLNETKADVSYLSKEQSETFDKTDCDQNGYIKTDGTYYSTSNWKCTGYILIPSYAKKFEYKCVNASNGYGVAFFDANKQAGNLGGINNGGVKDAENKQYGDIPSGAVYFRLSYKIADDDADGSMSLRLYIGGQEGYQQYTEALFAKAAEALTESAVSRSFVTEYNENDCIFDGYISKGNGSVSTSLDGFSCSDFLPVVPGTTLVLNTNWSANASGCVFFDANKTYISGISINNDTDTEVSVPSEAAYIRISCKPGAGGVTSVKWVSTGAAGLQKELDKYNRMLSSTEGDVNGRHVLMVSNSFGQDACANIKQILENMGVSKVHSLQRLHVSGSTLRGWATGVSEIGQSFSNLRLDLEYGHGLYHANGTLDDFLTLPWDVVVFQQASADSDDYTKYEPYLQQLIEKVRRICPNKSCEVKFMMTWETYLAPYADIISAVQSMRDNFGLEVLPVGTAIENIRQVYSDEQYNHLSSDPAANYQHLAAGVGEYTAGCALAMSLFGDIITENDHIIYDDDTNVSASSETGSVAVDSNNRAKCQRAAMYAVIHPWGTTDLSVING